MNIYIAHNFASDGLLEVNLNCVATKDLNKKKINEFLFLLFIRIENMELDFHSFVILRRNLFDEYERDVYRLFIWKERRANLFELKLPLFGLLSRN